MRTRTRTSAVAITAGAALLAALPLGAARAEAPATSLECDVELEVHFDTPISMEPSSGRIHTDTPGTATCTGSWRGSTGEFSAFVAYDGYFHDATCVEGNITGIIQIFGGDVGNTIEFPFNTRRIGPAPGVSRGETSDGSLSYVAAVLLSRGDGEDCLSKPLTGGRVDGRAVLYGP